MCNTATLILAILYSVVPNTSGIVFSHDAVIQDGDSYDHVTVVDTPPARTTVEMTGGEVTFALVTWNHSTVHVQAGWVNLLDTLEFSSATISGGRTDMMTFGGQSESTLLGGTHNNIDVKDQATLAVHGGVLAGGLGARGTTQVSIYGGGMPILGASGFAIIDLYGGSVADYLVASDSSRVNLYGYGFQYLPTGGSRGEGLVSGYWLDGTPFNLSLDQSEGDTLSHISFLPEPPTAPIALLALLTICRRRILRISR